MAGIKKISGTYMNAPWEMYIDPDELAWLMRPLDRGYPEGYNPNVTHVLLKGNPTWMQINMPMEEVIKWMQSK